MTRAIDPHLATGAHSLDALPDAERPEFEAHLDRCRDCADEVAQLRATAARLGSAVSSVSPVALRLSVLDAVRFVKQVPPDAEAVAVSSRPQGFRRATALVAAACVVAAVVGVVHGALISPAVPSVVASPRTHVGDLLSAPDLQLLSAKDRSAGVAVSRGRDEMLFLAEGLRELPHDRVYQLWLVRDNGPRSAGTARPAGTLTSMLVSGIDGADEAVLTTEPAGGSPGPTSAPIATVVLH
ncbi:anti-sigma factor [Lentzea sp. NPDC003310]|uniref:anti-sigma factor n=1 Tax=Lentzea sp. NPDC003310 TaxID=3154447 RepID=UPI0033A1DFF5